MAKDYKHAYKAFHASESAKKDRAARNNARRQALREGKAHKGDGKDVDHIDGNPRNNAAANKRVVSRSVNRAKH